MNSLRNECKKEHLVSTYFPLCVIQRLAYVSSVTEQACVGHLFQIFIISAEILRCVSGQKVAAKLVHSGWTLCQSADMCLKTKFKFHSIIRRGNVLHVGRNCGTLCDRLPLHWRKHVETCFAYLFRSPFRERTRRENAMPAANRTDPRQRDFQFHYGLCISLITSFVAGCFFYIGTHQYNPHNLVTPIFCVQQRVRMERALHHWNIDNSVKAIRFTRITRVSLRLYVIREFRWFQNSTRKNSADSVMYLRVTMLAVPEFA